VKPSSMFVLAAAFLFLVASFVAAMEHRPFPLVSAYFSLALANLGFSLLD